MSSQNFSKLTEKLCEFQQNRTIDSIQAQQKKTIFCDICQTDIELTRALHSQIIKCLKDKREYQRANKLRVDEPKIRCYEINLKNKCY